MLARPVSLGILPLALALGACAPQPADTDASDATAAEALPEDPCALTLEPMPPDEMGALKNRIRHEKFDQVLPVVMRANDIDMWIYVSRETLPDDLGHEDFGDNNAVFIFTDRGGDRIERAVLGRRFQGAEFVAGQGSDVDPLEVSGAYDIVGKPVERAEDPGMSGTEYDYRFKGIGAFVAERDPERIALNYMETLGPRIGGRSRDGISHTDYILLARELGETYASRLVSHDYLMHDYISRTTPAEWEFLAHMREYMLAVQERDWCRIVPGETRFSELDSVLWVVSKDGDRIGFREELYPGGFSSETDYVIQKGDTIYLRLGYFKTEGLVKEIFGNYYDGLNEIGYVLDDGETEAPQYVKDAWATSLKVHDIAERHLRVGSTGREIFRDIMAEVEEAGIMPLNSQVFDMNHADRIQVNLDFHAAGQGDSTLFPAPRLGIYGPDWNHEMPFPPGHHFYFEYFLFMPMPQWDEGSLLLQSHDGAILNEDGVLFLTPRPMEIRLIK